MSTTIGSEFIEFTKPPLQQVMVLCTIVMTQTDLSRPHHTFAHLMVALNGACRDVEDSLLSAGVRNLTGVERAVIMYKAGVPVTRAAELLGIDHQVLRRALAAYVRYMKKTMRITQDVEITLDNVPIESFMRAGAVGVFEYDHFKLKYLEPKQFKAPTPKSTKYYRKLLGYMDSGD